MGAIVDNLDISITEVKTMLRLNDAPVGDLTTAANVGDTNIVLTDVSSVRVDDLIQLGGEYVKVTAIDPNTNTLTVDALTGSYPAGTVVFNNPDNGFIKLLIDGAKDAADQYLETTLADLGGTVPNDIKVWCMRHIARYYESRPAGLKKISEGDIDRIILVDEEWYHSIHRYRDLHV